MNELRGGYVVSEPGDRIADLSRRLYGREGFEYTIREANVLTYAGPLTDELAAGVTYYGPPSYDYGEIIITDDAPAEAVPAIDPNLRPLRRVQHWANGHFKYLDGTEGLKVLIFDRNLKDFDAHSIEGLISIRASSSLFEGARTAEISFPYSDEIPPRANLYGNHVLVGYNGQPIFYGLLILPSLDLTGEKRITWAAQSHTFTAIETHFNPQHAKVEWTGATPYSIIADISARYKVPVFMDTEAENRLRLPAQDAEKIEEISSDILNTTPFKVIQTLADGVGLFVNSSMDGGFSIRSIDPSQTEIGEITEGGNFKISAQFNYKELARDYTVLTQRRDASEAGAAQIPEFPLPIFKNILRQNVVGDISLRTFFEVSKSFAKGVVISVEAIGWTAPDGLPWREGSVVRLKAPTLQIPNGKMVVSRVDFVGSKDAQQTNLKLSLPGVFSLRTPSTMPFLFEQDAEVGIDLVDLSTPEEE